MRSSRAQRAGSCARMPERERAEGQPSGWGWRRRWARGGRRPTTLPLVAPSHGPSCPTGGEGISHGRHLELRFRRPACAEESLPLILNIPLFLRGSVSDIKCNSRWEACDIFSVNTVLGWDRCPCQLTCMWKAPRALYS